MEHYLHIGMLIDPASYNGNITGREYDTRTGGIPERLLDANWPGDHMHPTNGCILVIQGPTVGSTMTNLDIDHRNRSANAWTELCSISATSANAYIFRAYIKDFRRFIRATFTITTSHVCIACLLAQNKREPVLHHDATHVPGDLTVTYA